MVSAVFGFTATPATAGCQSGNGANGTTTFLLDGMNCQGAAPGTGATAVGDGSWAKGARATSVGYFAGQPGGVGIEGATSVGAGSNNGGAGIYSTAIGAGLSSAAFVSSTGAYSNALGGGDGANFTPAIGPAIKLNGARATGFISIAIGTAAVASGGGSTAFGLGSKAIANDSAAYGEFSTASGASSIAIGVFTTASAGSSIAIGPNAKAMKGGAVALGKGSLANVANTVSVGNASLKRRIVNVAPGVAANDAVNLAQLQAAVAGARRSTSSLAGTSGTTTSQNVVDDLRRELSELRALLRQQQERITQLESRAVTAAE